MEKEKLCLRCMRKIGNNNSCPFCSKESSEPQTDPFLPIKTIVGGRYLVGKLVSTNSEGSTYYAFDMEKKTPVTIRELFPKGILSRGEGNYCLVNIGKASEFIDAKEEFVKLWNALSELKGFTALTEVYGLVEDLGTVYAVSEYLGEGKTLREYLLEQEQGYITWDEARVLFMPVLSALGELHNAGIVHGGICPETLILDTNGKLRISGYSIEAVRRQKSPLESELFDGYAAVEQYGFSEGLSTSTDIYAFSAVLYRTLIGSVPMSSASRLTNDKLMIPGKFAEQLPAYVINALVNGLQILPDDRTVTAEDLRGELSASPAAAGTASEAYSSMYASQEDEPDDVIVEEIAVDDEEDEAVAESPKIKKSTIAVFVISVVLCLGILIVALWGIKGFSGKDKEDATTEGTTIEALSEEDTTNKVGASSISVPNFRGKLFDDVKADDTYNGFLTFKTEYIDSDEKKGTVISQDITEGTLVFESRNITLKISNGREVPNVLDETLKDAVADLKAAGFKKVETVAGNIADNEDDSLKVYSVVCKDAKDNWVALPADRRLSVSDKIIIYYYGEYVAETVETTEEAVEDVPVEDNLTQAE